MSFIYNTFVYKPLYNGFVYLTDILPFLDLGVIVVIFTIIIKLVLFPLSRKAVRTQAMMKLVEPELNAIKEKYKNDRQNQAMQIMNLYREKGINPFSSIFLLFIQLPILFAMYKIFFVGLVPVNAEILYSFVSVPESVKILFLGLVDVGSKSWGIALLAAVSQFVQIHFSVPKLPPRRENASLSDDFARNMQTQMKYVLPIIIFFISYYATAALAIYWTTSNIFMIGQEIVVRRQLAREKSPNNKDSVKK